MYYLADIYIYIYIYIYVIPVQFITANDWKNFYHILTFIPLIITKI